MRKRPARPRCRGAATRSRRSEPEFPATAERVVFLFMAGGPSHVDLFDPKPELTRQHGKPLPAGFGKVITPMGTGGNDLLASKRKFARHGQSGLDFSDGLPHMAKCADDFTLLRACWADGLNRKETAEFGTRCLLARRPVERGVRFVQVYCGAGSQWDAHADIESNHTKMCLRADQPSAALLNDLKQRGLLKDTLVIWGGEFGRPR